MPETWRSLTGVAPSQEAPRYASDTAVNLETSPELGQFTWAEDNSGADADKKHARMCRAVLTSCMRTQWTQVLVGELGESLLDHLAIVSEELMLPLIMESAENAQLSRSATRDLTNNLHRFAANGEHQQSLLPKKILRS